MGVGFGGVSNFGYTSGSASGVKGQDGVGGGGIIAPGGGGGAWTPAQLFLGGEAGGWYDPSDLSTQAQNDDGSVAAAVDSPVGYCQDKSGNGNTVIQAVTASKFTLRQAGSLFYWEGDGGDWLRGTVASIGAPRTVAMAVRVDGVNDFAFDGDSNNTHSIATIGADLRLFSSSGLATPYSLSDDAVVTTLVNGASSYIRVNQTEVSGTTGTVAITAFTIGAAGALIVPILGRIYEVVVVDRALTAGEIASLEAYLAAKSGVTL